ncbi:MAG: preprotein translocase subunit YajC [Kiritimatiellae bacterium]|nr:preprotein translocase subunit YajC [Kiritimatiellia bacterium]
MNPQENAPAADAAVLAAAPAAAETAATTEQPAAPYAGEPQPQPGAFGSPMVIMLLMFAILYFVMIRPQQRKEKERRAQIDALRAGVRVLFCGGMIGTIEEVKKEGTFLVRVADGVVVEIARGAVERPLPDAKA